MSRRRRVWYPGAFYHVMSRGNGRNVIFNERGDFHRFLDIMKEEKEKHPFTMHAMCLMSNHFHFLIECHDTELSVIMRKILVTYAKDYNFRYEHTGHVFENRYKAYLIDDDSYFLEVSRYIHLNPVNAYMVAKPLDYDYSSYHCYCDNIPVSADQRARKLISDMVTTDRVLGYFRNKSKEKYRYFVEDMPLHEKYEQQIQNDIKEDDM